MSNNKWKQRKFYPRNPKKYRGDPTQIFMRSSWETSVAIWLDTNPSVVEWSSETVVIPYISPIDNKEHKYHPDFKIGENVFVEIKGQMDDISKIKIKEFIKNNPNLELKIISFNEIQPYLKYVKEKYGYKFYEILYENE